MHAYSGSSLVKFTSTSTLGRKERRKKEIIKNDIRKERKINRSKQINKEIIGKK